VVVDAEINGTIKTTLRSERRSLLEKEKKEQENQKRGLDKVGIVRDVWLRRRSQWVVATLAQGCLQQFQNVTFFDCIELTARPFKRSKNQPFSLQKTRKVRTELQTTCL